MVNSFYLFVYLFIYTKADILQYFLTKLAFWYLKNSIVVSELLYYYIKWQCLMASYFALLLYWESIRCICHLQLLGSRNHILLSWVLNYFPFFFQKSYIIISSLIYFLFKRYLHNIINIYYVSILPPLKYEISMFYQLNCKPFNLLLDQNWYLAVFLTKAGLLIYENFHYSL